MAGWGRRAATRYYTHCRIGKGNLRGNGLALGDWEGGWGGIQMVRGGEAHRVQL